MTKFQTLLRQAYLEWCNENNEVLTKKDWAKYIGINYSQMSHYFSGRRTPSGNNLTKLTKAIGPRVLTALGLVHDPMLKAVLENYHELSAEDKKRIVQEVSKYAPEVDKTILRT